MRHWIIAAALIAGFLVMAPAARASGDSGCDPTMKIFRDGFTGCDSVGFLSPGNDTRINLTFLLADQRKQKLEARTLVQGRYAQPVTYAPQDWQSFIAALTPDPVTDVNASGETYGEGTICVSDDKGRADFIAAVMAAADITDAEKQALSEARKALKCERNGTTRATLPPVQSPSAREFAAYLAAVDGFYGSTHSDASAFVPLSSSTQPWVKEAATYMQARTLLLAAQASAFDEYGVLKREQIDAKAVTAALAALQAYVKSYPAGIYKSSAEGLMRRAYWLADDRGNQAASYSALIKASPVNAETLDAVNELDLKLPVEAYQETTADPLVKAVQILRELRAQTDSDGKPKPGMTKEALEMRRSQFQTQPELFDYLLATRAWFVDKDAKAVLALLPEKTPDADLTYLDFSRQFLRAQSLAALGDEAARAAFVALFAHANSAWQRGTLELALALYDERHKNISAVFSEGLIKDPVIRKEVLDKIAGPILLRQQAEAKDASADERETALYRLLSRDLVQGRFKGFLDDVKLMPSGEEALAAHKADAYPADLFAPFRWAGEKSGFACPAIADIANTLVGNPKDITARLCLGDFYRATSVSDVGVSDKDALGGTGTIFSGAVIARGDIYAETLKNPAASHTQKAYSLFRSVKCYEPAHSNDCGGADVGEATRKGWYDELKHRYGDTPFAAKLRYYW